MKLPYTIYASTMHQSYPNERDYFWDWVGTTELEADESHRCTEDLSGLIDYVRGHLSPDFQAITIQTFILEYWDTAVTDSTQIYDYATHVFDVYSMYLGKFLYRIYQFDDGEEIYENDENNNEEDIIIYYRNMDHSYDD